VCPIPVSQGLLLLEVVLPKSGHDTDMHRSSDEVYANLHGCCKYNREEVKVKQECGQTCHGHQ
jgi:hypothetical protein